MDQNARKTLQQGYFSDTFLSLSKGLRLQQWKHTWVQTDRISTNRHNSAILVQLELHVNICFWKISQMDVGFCFWNKTKPQKGSKCTNIVDNSRQRNTDLDIKFDMMVREKCSITQVFIFFCLGSNTRAQEKTPVGSLVGSAQNTYCWKIQNLEHDKWVLSRPTVLDCTSCFLLTWCSFPTIRLIC